METHSVRKASPGAARVFRKKKSAPVTGTAGVDLSSLNARALMPQPYTNYNEKIDLQYYLKKAHQLLKYMQCDVCKTDYRTYEEYVASLFLKVKSVYGDIGIVYMEEPYDQAVRFDMPLPDVDCQYDVILEPLHYAYTLKPSFFNPIIGVLYRCTQAFSFTTYHEHWQQWGEQTYKQRWKEGKEQVAQQIYQCYQFGPAAEFNLIMQARAEMLCDAILIWMLDTHVAQTELEYRWQKWVENSLDLLTWGVSLEDFRDFESDLSSLNQLYTACYDDDDFMETIGHEIESSLNGMGYEDRHFHWWTKDLKQLNLYTSLFMHQFKEWYKQLSQLTYDQRRDNRSVLSDTDLMHRNLQRHRRHIRRRA